jgi:ribose transport system substrate-binding protein
VRVRADHGKGGRAAARYVVDKLHGKGTIIELEGTPGVSPAIDRKKGFDEVRSIGHDAKKTVHRVVSDYVADFKSEPEQGLKEGDPRLPTKALQNRR